MVEIRLTLRVSCNVRRLIRVESNGRGIGGCAPSAAADSSTANTFSCQFVSNWKCEAISRSDFGGVKSVWCNITRVAFWRPCLFVSYTVIIEVVLGRL